MKVYKSGSFGRSIDLTRYKGYDELRHDLALMFGIEGQLEDPQQTFWKLVYVDLNDEFFLVGSDTWEYVQTSKFALFTVFSFLTFLCFLILIL